MSFPLGLGDALAVFALVALAASVQASVGFGLGLISAPLLFLIYPPLVPGPLMAATILLALLIAFRERGAIDVSGLGFALAGRVVGTLVAAFVLSTLSAKAFDVLFAGLVLLGVALSTSSLHVTPGPVSATAAGALSGFMGTLSSIGGPPMALLYQWESAARLRGTLSGFFVIGSSLSIAALAIVGRYGSEEVVLSIYLLPAICAGFLASKWIQKAMERFGARPLILWLSFLAAIGVLYRVLGG